jgi:hypothetical protein
MDSLNGSKWGKWDLHIHTPNSFLANKFGDPSLEATWDNYIKSLFKKALDKGIATIGLCDYFSIEGYEKVLSYLENEDKLKSKEIGFSQEDVEKIKKILILPNIEFRLKCLVGNGNRVNFHVIFSNDVSIREIKENFIEDLKFEDQARPSTPDEIKNLCRSNLETLGPRLKAQDLRSYAAHIK